MSKLQEAKELLAATEGHTPGPWRGVMDGHMHAVRADTLFGDYSVCIDPERKNVALIAAAPDLRELLAAMVAEVEQSQKEAKILRYALCTIGGLTPDVRSLLGFVRTGVQPTERLLNAISANIGQVQVLLHDLSEARPQ